MQDDQYMTCMRIISMQSYHVTFLITKHAEVAIVMISPTMTLNKLTINFLTTSKEIFTSRKYKSECPKRWALLLPATIDRYPTSIESS